ncbi:hypothetical protein ACFE04_003872 [Oxalis oulophora]
MWRSIAKLNQTLARNFTVIKRNPSKFQYLSSSTTKTIVTKSQSKGSIFHFNQNPRFLSQTSSADGPSDFNTATSQQEQPFDIETVENVEKDGTQMINESGIVDVDENSDIPLENLEPEVVELDSEKLESVLSLLQSNVDGSLESSLKALSLHLNEEFMVRVLETPLLLGENLIVFFKYAMKKPEFTLSTNVVDMLGKGMCSDVRKGNAYALWDLFKEIGETEKGLLNVDVLNELIATLSKLGKGKAAVEVFEKFEDFGCVPNAESYYFTIESLCRRSYYDWAWTVCEKMLDSGSLPVGNRLSKIISWFCKGDKPKEAHTVYIIAKERKEGISLSSFNFLVSSLCKKDDTVKLASEMLDDFSGEARKYAIKPFSVVISALCRTKEVDKTANLIFNLISQGPPPGNSVFNAVVRGYSQTGDLGKAKEMIKLMESRGLKPDVSTYALVISGYASAGQMEEACRNLATAKKKHSKLSHAIYNPLIRGYCELEEFEKALKLLAEMKDFGVEASGAEYNKLIQSLCLKALDWGRAETLFEEMKAKGLNLNGMTRSLIRAVKELEGEKLGNVEEEIVKA